MTDFSKILCCINDGTLSNGIDIHKDDDYDKLCGICIRPLEHKTTITELKNSCRHEFCQACVVTMVQYCKSKNIILRCPLCRNE
tara:strand:- start:1176 stop:1427 length:252 start_codon:yes stop_codon:yes gene_type:complete